MPWLIIGSIGAMLLLIALASSRGKVTVTSGVTVNDTQMAVARAASDYAGAPVQVTSGTRTYEGQAEAMWNKYNAIGLDAMYDLYRYAGSIGLLAEMFRASHDKWAGIIERYANEGKVISRHLTGEAIDIIPAADADGHTMTVAELASALKGFTYVSGITGDSPLNEGDHVHLEWVTA